MRKFKTTNGPAGTSSEGVGGRAVAATTTFARTVTRRRWGLREHEYGIERAWSTWDVVRKVSDCPAAEVFGLVTGVI